MWSDWPSGYLREVLFPVSARERRVSEYKEIYGEEKVQSASRKPDRKQWKRARLSNFSKVPFLEVAILALFLFHSSTSSGSFTSSLRVQARSWRALDVLPLPLAHSKRTKFEILPLLRLFSCPPNRYALLSTAICLMFSTQNASFKFNNRRVPWTHALGITTTTRCPIQER